MWLKLNAALQLIPRQGKLYSIRYDLMLQCCNKMNAHNTSYLNDDQIIHMDNLWSDYTLIIAAYLFISVNNLFSRSSFNIHYWWSLFLSCFCDYVIMWPLSHSRALGNKDPDTEKQLLYVFSWHGVPTLFAAEQFGLVLSCLEAIKG